MNLHKNLKLLIVDDEEFMREGLKVYLDWEQYSIKEILTAEDGITALEIVQAEKPDLVITDIKMPEMTGIELISRIKKILPECVCVIISGYNDFEYAKKSIALGVYYYMVKPIELEELKTVVSMAVEAVEKKIKEREILNLIEETSLNKKKYNIQHFFSKIISEKNESERNRLEVSMNTMETTLQFPYYALCVTRLSGKQALQQDWVDSLFPTTEQKIKDIFSNKKEVAVFCLSEKNSFITILGLHTVEKLNFLAEEIFHMVFKTVSNCFHVSLVTVLGKPVSNIRDLFLSNKEVQKLCAYRTFFQENGFFIAQQSNVSENEHFIFSTEYKNLLLAKFEANDITGIKGILDELQNLSCHSYHQDKNVLFAFILELLISVIRLLDSKKLKIERYIHIEDISSDFLETFETADQMFEWLQNCFAVLSVANLNLKKVGPESLLVEQIKHYVEENFRENITLDEIACYFKYSSNYIGRLFKKNEKIKISDYLNNVRVENICNLLQTTNISITQIANQSGYNDCQYFMKVFKAKMGTTPGKFRAEMERKNHGGSYAKNNPK